MPFSFKTWADDPLYHADLSSFASASVVRVSAKWSRLFKGRNR
jgi:hypothetical protein